MPELPEVQTIVNDLKRAIVGRRIKDVWFDWPRMFKFPARSESLPGFTAGASGEILSDKSPALRDHNLTPHSSTALRPRYSGGQIKFLARDLKNKNILKVERRAKYIKIYLSDRPRESLPAGRQARHDPRESALLDKERDATDSQRSQPQSAESALLMVFHLKMTGRFWLIKKELATSDWRKKHYAHLILFLDKGLALVFSDMRKFGTARFGKVAEIENLPEMRELGPEPMDLKFGQLRRSASPDVTSGERGRSLPTYVGRFVSSVRKTRRKIKQVLMDPKIIAGIGNIYSDEALWVAKIHPLRRADSLTVDELKSLLTAIKKILQKSLKLRGTTVRDYRDLSGKQGSYYNRRLVYHREGEPCRRCRAKIKRIRIGGRSAYFCPKCQTL